jgi:hypothetical protein
LEGAVAVTHRGEGRTAIPVIVISVKKIACHFIRRAQMLPVLDREVVEADGRRDT